MEFICGYVGFVGVVGLMGVCACVVCEEVRRGLPHAYSHLPCGTQHLVLAAAISLAIGVLMTHCRHTPMVAQRHLEHG